MVLFKDFYKKLLNEGGNVKVNGLQAQKLKMKDFDRFPFIEDFKKFLFSIDTEFKKDFKSNLWPNLSKNIKNNEIYSGSTRAFFDKSKSNEQYSKFKPLVGDFDIQFPETNYSNLKVTLSRLFNKNINGFKIIGIGPSQIDQYNALVQMPDKYKDIAEYFQVDFEGVEFSDSEPSPWSNFAHYSSWTDVENNIKGIFIKFLWQALTSLDRVKNAVIETKSGKISKSSKWLDPDKIGFSKNALSVMKGLRLKLVPVYDENNKIKIINGKQVYRELDTKESTFDTNLETIFSSVFKYKPLPKDIKSMHSFVKTLNLIKHNISDKNLILMVFNIFINKLWSPSAQGIERNNPDLDTEIKSFAFNKFLEVFPFLEKERLKIEEKVIKYKKNYRMT